MNVRLLALAGVVAGAVALPLAVASAGPVGRADEGRSVVRSSAHGDGSAADSSYSAGSSGSSRSSGPSSSVGGDEKAPSAGPARSPLLLGLGLATAVRCGPELTSPDGIEAQTCVLTQGEDTWARTYYRNATGDDLDAALSVMAPGGRTVQINCAVGAEDEPGTCETPRERTQGALDAYTAVAEFAGRSGRGPLLLRSGSDTESGAASGPASDLESNSGLHTGS
ncbi:hypothetical protein [Streptomyces sp. NPDC001315]|uniref:hypothetical protein n=1 Tax=Streptomyces sp. NPDC001315 TaxID=3364562 RepID=UPI0036BDAA70